MKPKIFSNDRIRAGRSAPPALRQAMHTIETKGLLSARNGFNLYRGCTHGCIYCDSRSACYGMNHAFEDVAVKRNAPELLDSALRAKRRPCMLSTGSMSDPYLPLEKDLRLTRRCLEIIRNRGFGLAVLTKSDLILRDFDLLCEINRQAKCVVQMTLTAWDEPLSRVLEPNVCSTRRRVEVLRAFHEAGVPTVAWLCPFLPFLTDTEENLRALLSACADAGVYGVITFGFGVTLREGNREFFYRALDARFPGLTAEYVRRFHNAYACESPNAARLGQILQSECARYGIHCGTDALFTFLQTLPTRQTSLFDSL